MLNLPVPASRPVSYLPGRVDRAIRAEQYHGVQEAVAVQAAGFVAFTALTMVASLSAEEERLSRACPQAELRLHAIGDTFAGVACARVARMGWF